LNLNASGKNGMPVTSSPPASHGQTWMQISEIQKSPSNTPGLQIISTNGKELNGTTKNSIRNENKIEIIATPGSVLDQNQTKVIKLLNGAIALAPMDKDSKMFQLSQVCLAAG
jgi:hypothetical protein